MPVCVCLAFTRQLEAAGSLPDMVAMLFGIGYLIATSLLLLFLELRGNNLRYEHCRTKCATLARQ
jgi:hypothetical protein